MTLPIQIHNVDRDKYAFSYGKDFTKKPVIGSGLVLENGKLPIVSLSN
jgi:hypothetical protein